MPTEFSAIAHRTHDRRARRSPAACPLRSRRAPCRRRARASTATVAAAAATASAAEQRVARSRPELQHRRPGAEHRNGEHAAAEVVGAEERGRPAVPLRHRLARGGDREEQEAGRPERLLRRRPAPVRAGEQQRRRARRRASPRSAAAPWPTGAVRSPAGASVDDRGIRARRSSGRRSRGRRTSPRASRRRRTGPGRSGDSGARERERPPRASERRAARAGLCRASYRRYADVASSAAARTSSARASRA